jgi:hypothetical protein
VEILAILPALEVGLSADEGGTFDIAGNGRGILALSMNLGREYMCDDGGRSVTGFGVGTFTLAGKVDIGRGSFDREPGLETWVRL